MSGRRGPVLLSGSAGEGEGEGKGDHSKPRFSLSSGQNSISRIRNRSMDGEGRDLGSGGPPATPSGVHGRTSTVSTPLLCGPHPSTYPGSLKIDQGTRVSTQWLVILFYVSI